MKKVITRDSSVTFFNEQYGDYYHSHTVGAIEEGIVKFAEPCRIKDGMKILDVCFGLGYNTLSALCFSKNIEVVGLENDTKILEMIGDMDVPSKYTEDYKIVKKAAKSHNLVSGRLKIRILLGDARQTIMEAGDGFDAVFLDPFSPKKCPELWTREFFSEIYKRMKRGGIIATYSCATHVRKNLADAGFAVKDGPIFGRKSPATVGVKE